jgi:hypothetical protein
VIASGESYADSLPAIALAGARNYGFMLVKPTTIAGTYIDTVLDTKQISNIIIVGGTSAVSSSTETTLINHFGSSMVKRFTGIDRYQTSTTCATAAISTLGMTATTIGFATGESFPDALSAAAAQGQKGNVMLLAANGHTNYAVTWLNGRVGSNTAIYGGISAIPYNAKRAIRVPIATISLQGWDLLDSQDYVTWTGSTTYQTQFNAAVATWNTTRPSFNTVRHISASNNPTLYPRIVYIGDVHDNADSSFATTYSTGSIVFNPARLGSYTDNTNVIQKVCTHELGHAMGLGHSQTALDVMRQGDHSTIRPRINDLASFDALWAQYGY